MNNGFDDITDPLWIRATKMSFQFHNVKNGIEKTKSGKIFNEKMCRNNNNNLTSSQNQACSNIGYFWCMTYPRGLSTGNRQCTYF